MHAALGVDLIECDTCRMSRSEVSLMAMVPERECEHTDLHRILGLNAQAQWMVKMESMSLEKLAFIFS